MVSTRCAACKYLRRRCPSDCIFAPYFPSTNPQRFACVHKIFGASNVGKMLKQFPDQLRTKAADSLHFEAEKRIQDPVYGCVGIITQLQQQIHDAQRELAKVQAEIAFNVQQSDFHSNPLHSQQLETSLSHNVVQEDPTRNVVINQPFVYPFIRDPGLL